MAQKSESEPEQVAAAAEHQLLRLMSDCQGAKVESTK